MKNLFKNLMLVAVAAMAFTACQNDNNDVNEVAKKTVISGVLCFDEETRSGFVGKNEAGNAYVSEWDGGETIKLFANSLETTATVDEEGKFTAQFEGELPESFYMTVCSPAESWSSQSTSTIPAEQTPRANSVDPKAHLLQAQNVQVSNGTADAIVMIHQPAYGKMIVNAPESFVIDKVVINLVGTFFGYDRECTYTINADNVENNTFWFATEPIDVAEFTVTAYNAEGNAVAKTVSMEGKEKPLAFDYGQVSTFSVSGLEEPVAFTRAYVDEYASSTSDYVIWFEGPAGKLKTNPCNITTEDWALIPGTYNVQTGGQCFYNGSWTALNGLSSDRGTVTVSVVNGMYHFDFNIIHTNGSVFTGSYTGLVEGLNIPDSRTQLAAPTATATADGNVITISWNEVTGADEYYVSCTNGGLDAITTTDTSVTIEAEYSTKYDFSIKAVAHDSNPNYKTSGVYNFSVTTGENPNVEYISLTSMSEGVYEGASWNYRFTFKGDNSEFILAWSYKKATNTTITSGDYTYNSNYSVLDGWGDVFGANNIYKFDGINAKISGGTINVSSEGNVYTITMRLTLNSGDVKLFKYVGEIGVTSEPDPEPDPDQPTPDPDPTPGDGGVTIKYIKNYGPSYTHLCYYELTSGNDVIGFWMNNNKSNKTTMYDGTYTYGKDMSAVNSSTSKIYIEMNKIDGVNKSGVQNTSKMVVSNNGGHIEFKLEYWDTSVKDFVIKEYVFDGTIQ